MTDIENQKFYSFCDDVINSHEFTFFVSVKDDDSVSVGCGEEDDPLVIFNLTRKVANKYGLDSSEKIPSDIQKND